MKAHFTFMKGRLARRILLRFVLCALVPLMVLAGVAFFQVRAELENQGRLRLHESSRSFVNSVLERLLNLENDLAVLAMEILDPGSAFQHSQKTESFLKHLQRRFSAVIVMQDSGPSIRLFGNMDSLPELSSGDEAHLQSGKTLISIDYSGKNKSRMLMMRRFSPSGERSGMLCGQVHLMYLWGLEEHDTLPGMTELCILDHSNEVIFSTHPIPWGFSERPEFKYGRSSLASLEWEYGGEEYLAGFCPILTNYRWLYPRMTAVMSSSKHHIFAPISLFKKIFPFVVLLSLLVVLLLSAIQIRKTTQPLIILKESAKRVAMKDFNALVKVNSGDEFQDLGESFNSMAIRLGKQFNALVTMAEIDRAILSELNTERIISGLAKRMKTFFGHEVMLVFLHEPKSKSGVRCYYCLESGPHISIQRDDMELNWQEVEKLVDHPEMVLFDSGDRLPPFLVPVFSKGLTSLVVLPLFLKEALAGVIIFGTVEPEGFAQEDIVQARQLANQVAVALANAKLVEELDALNWGTLMALARAVDAKSAWTAGHSERVTKIAISIGRVMGFSEPEIETLRRAGLLHDIGKLATPFEVLDKSGALTLEERIMVEEHPRIGARILEPIDAYDAVVPMVLQHHECFDGSGYPNGLAGREITLGGRILAVADFYDALNTDRPYRQAIERSEVIISIRQEAGRRFDPLVVSAFLKVFTGEKKNEI